ncbi:MAG: vitamin K epoxide reductase family protein [Bryobacteraceae bacterium]
MPEQDTLRTGSEPLLKNRRAIAGLSVFSGTVLGGIALFQMGVFKKLPDPPLAFFDSERVNGSKEAYSIAETPDALLGMISYAATGCLAGMGGTDRWTTQRWIPIALAVKTAADAALAGKLSIEQWTKFRKFSFWSMLVAGATFAACPLAIPEAKQAWKQRP